MSFGVPDVYTLHAFGREDATCTFRSTPAKAAMFDLDGTIITTKGKHTFPKSLDDWRLLNENVSSTLKTLYESGYDIVIITNQMKLSNVDIITKAGNIHAALEVPFILLSGHKEEFYRKPMTGLYSVLTEKVGPIDMTSSFFVGDMYTDAYFAHNIGLTFHWAGIYFRESPTSALVIPAHPMASSIHMTEERAQHPLIDTQPNLHLIVLMGAPASGKSSIAARLASSPNSYTVINRDSLKTDAKMKKVFNEAIAAGSSIVIDNTNPQRTTRAQWINAAKAANINYKTTILFIDLPRITAMYLNDYRKETSKGVSNHVPAIVYNIFYSKVEPPLTSEADEIMTWNYISVQNESERESIMRYRF